MKITRGKIKVYEGNKIRIVTTCCKEETADFFTFDELMEFLESTKNEQYKEWDEINAKDGTKFVLSSREACILNYVINNDLEQDISALKEKSQ